jgi:hypothetical protein
MRILARLVHRAVDGEPRGVDLEGRLHHLLAGEVHLDQARGVISSNIMP